MGHAIRGVASAYLNMPTDELRKLYMTAEEYLKIEKTSRDEMDEKSSQVKLSPEVKEKMQIFSDDVDRFRDELAQSKADVADLKEKLECAVAYISSLRDETELREKAEAQENFNKLVEEINKEHPIAKEAKTSKKITPI